MPDITPIASQLWQFIDHWQALIASILVIAAAGVFAAVLNRQMRQNSAAAVLQEAAQQKLWAAIVEAADRHIAAALAPAATAYDAVLQRLAELQARLEAAEQHAKEEAQRSAAAREHSQAIEREATDDRPHLSGTQTPTSPSAAVIGNALGEGR
jgi:cobalamin-dependent methionine synthase I